MKYQVIVSVSGGVTGSRRSVLKDKDGNAKRFDNRADADKCAADYISGMNGPYATARFSAYVSEVEE